MSNNADTAAPSGPQESSISPPGLATADGASRAGRPRAFDIDVALDAAIVVFSAHGYHGTSITDLKAAMGLTAGSIYKAFKDKRAIFLAAYDRYKAVRAALMDEALSGAETGLEKLRRVLYVYADSARGETGRRGCLAIGAAVELALFDAEVDARVARGNARTMGMIEGFLREGQADGSVDDSLDPGVTALALFSLIQGLRVTGKSGEQAHSTRAVADLALAGLKSRSAPRQADPAGGRSP